MSVSHILAIHSPHILFREKIGMDWNGMEWIGLPGMDLLAHTKSHFSGTPFIVPVIPKRAIQNIAICDASNLTFLAYLLLLLLL